MGNVVSLTGKVVSLPAAREAEILEALRHYLIRGEQGKLRGVSLCVMDDTGHEEQVVVGEYRRNLALGVNASVQMTIKLARLQEEHRPPKSNGWRPL